MDIGILGTGNLAVALGRAWAAAGHSLLLTGRDPEHVRHAAERVGHRARAVDPGGFAERVTVVVVAVAWDGLADALSLVGADEGALTGTTVIDCTNPIDYRTGAMVPATGSAADLVTRLAPGAHVLKGLHLFAGAMWPFTGPPESAPVVAVCGDQEAALDQVRSLVGDLGGRMVVIGGLDSARQIEEVAGFVTRVVAAGANPRLAVPDVDPALLRAPRSTDT